MNVDSKILYEIWLLSVWNKKSDDCMRYDNAPNMETEVSSLKTEASRLKSQDWSLKKVKEKKK